MSSDIKNIQNKAQQFLLEQKLNRAKEQSRNAGQKSEEIKAAARQFEALFVNRLLKEMRKTIIKSNLLGEGFGGEIFRDMFDEKLAEEISERSTLGLADVIARQLGADELQPAVPLAPVKMPRASTPVNIDFLNKKLKPFMNEIMDTARTMELNPNLIQAVILAESGGNARAVSPKGAKGLMQLMDGTADEMGVKNNFDPAENIRGGSGYLKKMMVMFNGDLDKALAAYNAGPNAVRKYNGVPPYDETENYIKKIKAYFRALSSAE